jgi:hypothetical protein
MISVSFLILYLMEVLRVTCPLFDVNGNLVSSSEDEAAEDLFNGLFALIESNRVRTH